MTEKKPGTVEVFLSEDPHDSVVVDGVTTVEFDLSGLWLKSAGGFTLAYFTNYAGYRWLN